MDWAAITPAIITIADANITAVDMLLFFIFKSINYTDFNLKNLIHSEKYNTPKSPKGDFAEFVNFQRLPLGGRGKIVENQQTIDFGVDSKFNSVFKMHIIFIKSSNNVKILVLW